MRHPAVVAMIRLKLSPEEELARRTLDLLKRLTGSSDTKIGAARGVKHQATAQRREGTTRIHPHRDVPYFADVMGVDPACFYMSTDELLEWIKDHRPDLFAALPPWGRR